MKLDDIPGLPGVYTIFSKDGRKGYVGSTSNLRRRLLRHKRELNKRTHYNPGLQEIYDYHMGQLDIVVKVTEDRETAYDAEQYTLDSLFKTAQLCNIAMDARSSALGLKHKPEAIAKIVAFNTGRPKSREHREAIRRRLTGRKLPPEHAEKARKASVGYKQSDDHVVKRAQAMKDVPKTDEHKAKLKAAKVFPVEVDGQTYRNAQAAGDAFGISRQAVFKRIDNSNFPGWKKKE